MNGTLIIFFLYGIMIHIMIMIERKTQNKILKNEKRLACGIDIGPMRITDNMTVMHD